ncbi:hypothetical protein H5P28_14755 [Ruficoccus amylovorans]|uniref:Uncharacterized protein n=1 Tax=Ruficoccus amylovorans TaxID=1804625 RepID=A0A842HIV5_9BACT|nr:hypothetical protein [Ruficoccus amylovorans]MBC2595524.1 hypothetical protein [Ruficoccus amylovorans]
MKNLSKLISTTTLLLGASAAFAMQSAPTSEEAAAPSSTEYAETLTKTAKSVATENTLSAIDSLKSSFSGNKEASSLLSSAINSFKGGDTLKSLDTLNQLSELDLTDKQSQLVEEVKGTVSAYSLNQNFDTSDPNLSGPVNNAIAAIKTGDKTAAAKSLGEIYEMGSLTDKQKEVLTSVASDYAGVDLGKIGDAVNAAKSVKDMF